MKCRIAITNMRCTNMGIAIPQEQVHYEVLKKRVLDLAKWGVHFFKDNSQSREKILSC
jgi:hypothetical protein